MNKKKIIYVIFAFLCILYVFFLFVFDMPKSKGDIPVIKASSSVLEVSVKAKQNDLLAGMSASDKEDGNLTKNIFIEKISEFDEKQERTVTYAVFDSDDNITRITRKVKYNDYKKPVLNIKKPLVYYYYLTNDEYKSYLTASSSVDGDISSKIVVKQSTNNDIIQQITFSVTDSCGMTTTLELNAHGVNKNPNIDIELKTYLKRVKVGATLTEIAPRDTIKSISIMGIKDMSLKPEVELTHNYNPNVPGIYEFIYRISKSNGDYGMTKLVVIVEE